MTDIRITDQHIRVYDDGHVVVLQKRITMTDTIAPALTPDEWHHHTKRLDPWSVIVFGGSIAVEGPDPQEAVALTEPGAIAALMAAANYELPDDSEYKITRQDVESINDALHRMEPYDQDRSYTPGEIATHARLVILAAKLAALLPPE